MNVVAKFPVFPATTPLFGSLVNEFFNRPVGDFVGYDATLGQVPAVNVLETADEYRMRVAAPGFAKENFSVQVDGNQLTIGAETEAKNAETDERFTRREFNFSSFKRAFRLPETVNTTAIGAVYENGILTVTVPKKEESKPIQRTVAIQ